MSDFAVQTFDEYQAAAGETAMYPNRGNNPFYPALGLAEEAGEVAGQLKRVIRDDGGELTETRRAAIKKELGDVLWYVAALASELNFSMAEIAEENILKLRDRKKRGVISGHGDAR